jgi:hypothetical protein
MKKIQIFIIFTLTILPIYAHSFDELIKSDSSITGKVVDKNTGEPLTGVSVKLPGLNLTVYSDFDGNFSFNNVFPGKYDLSASMLTYQNVKKEKFLVNKGKNNYLKIELEAIK